MIAGDWVITSKGRYAKILELDSITEAACVKIGEHKHWISLDQLSNSKDGTLFNVTYTIGKEYEEHQQHVFIKRNTKLYDITDRTADLYETVKLALMKIVGQQVRINKIVIS